MSKKYEFFIALTTYRVLSRIHFLLQDFSRLGSCFSIEIPGKGRIYFLNFCFACVFKKYFNIF